MKTTLAEILKQIAPLPYKKLSYPYIISGEDGIEHPPEARQKEEATAAYLVHAANEFPKLLEAYAKLLLAHEAYQIDWALFNRNSPDYQVNYKPYFDKATLEAQKYLKQATTIEI